MGHIVTTTMPTPPRKITPTLHKCISTNCLINLVQVWQYIWIEDYSKLHNPNSKPTTMNAMQIDLNANVAMSRIKMLSIMFLGVRKHVTKRGLH